MDQRPVAWRTLDVGGRRPSSTVSPVTACDFELGRGDPCGVDAAGRCAACEARSCTSHLGRGACRTCSESALRDALDEWNEWASQALDEFFTAPPELSIATIHIGEHSGAEPHHRLAIHVIRPYNSEAEIEGLAVNLGAREFYRLPRSGAVVPCGPTPFAHTPPQNVEHPEGYRRFQERAVLRRNLARIQFATTLGTSR